MKLSTIWRAYTRANNLHIEAEKNFIYFMNDATITEELGAAIGKIYKRRKRQAESFSNAINLRIRKDATITKRLDNLHHMMFESKQDEFEEWLKS